MNDEVTLINRVMQRIPNKYMAMIVAAKRAKELNQGARPLVKVDAAKLTTTALNEIAEGFIEPRVGKIDKEMLLIDPDSDEGIPSPELIIDGIEEEIREADEDIDLDDEEDDDDDEEDEDEDDLDEDYDEDDEDDVDDDEDDE